MKYIDNRRQPRVLVFCVALNFYDTVYGSNIESHRSYARKNGYHYTLVNRPHSLSIRESVWLKIPLIEAALNTGWDWVLFVDADCELRPDAPRIETLQSGASSVFLAPGFSGNVNSGVIIARNAVSSRWFFAQVWAAAGLALPEEDWGENGHVIHFARTFEHLRILDRRWNNNADPSMMDFIRHYSAGGPMRPLYRFGWRARIAKLAARSMQKVLKLSGLGEPDKSQIVAELGRHCDSVARSHPEAFGNRYLCPAPSTGVSFAFDAELSGPKTIG